MNLLLKNTEWLDRNLVATRGDIRIRGRHIVEIGERLAPAKGTWLAGREHVIDLSGHITFPGRINAHDHLEMNLYPRLGTPRYSNYTEWSKDIYHPERSPLREIESTDIRRRLMWGGLKNLISGVTTVVHHNPWNPLLASPDFPVNVHRTEWAHSLKFEKDVVAKRGDRTRTFVIHAGEGVDELARNEIDQLTELRLLDSRCVIVHGVAIGPAEAERIAKSGTSVVWCPASNLYMFGKTLDASLFQTLQVALGTDSTLTGSPTFQDEMRLAIESGRSPSELYNLTGATAAHIFGLPDPVIETGASADIVIVPKQYPDILTNIVGARPADLLLVLIGGRIRLAGATLSLLRLKHQFLLEGQLKYTDIDVASLKGYFERKVGRELLSPNPLWNLISV